VLDSLPLVLLGRVKATKDPEKMGRIQVEVDGYGGKVILPWLRMLQATASKKTGHLFLPEIGDEVAILRGDGNHAEGMLILGCLYGGSERVPLTPEADDKNNIKQIVTRAKHEITFDDADDKGSITVKTGDGNMSVVLDVVKKKVTVNSAEELEITSTKAMLIKTDDKLTIDAKEIDAKTSAAMTFTASGDFTAEGANSTVKGSSSGTFDGGGSATIKGGSIKLGK